MNELHRDRSFTDSGSDSLDGTVAHITHRKNAGNISLEQEGIAIESPAFRPLPVTDQVRTGQQESALVPLDDASQKIRPRQLSNNDKHRTGRHTLRLAG